MSARTFVSIPLSPDGDRAICRTDAWGYVAEVEVITSDDVSRHRLNRRGCSCGASDCRGESLLERAAESGLRPFEPQGAAFDLVRRTGGEAEWLRPYGMAGDLGPASVYASRTSAQVTLVVEVGADRQTFDVQNGSCTCRREPTCLHRQLALEFGRS